MSFWGAHEFLRSPRVFEEPMSLWGAHVFGHTTKNRPLKIISHEDCTAGIRVSPEGPTDPLKVIHSHFWPREPTLHSQISDFQNLNATFLHEIMICVIDIDRNRFITPFKHSATTLKIGPPLHILLRNICNCIISSCYWGQVWSTKVGCCLSCKFRWDGYKTSWRKIDCLRWQHCRFKNQDTLWLIGLIFNQSN